MRFLIDQKRSPLLAELLRNAGHDAVHTIDLGLANAEDDELIAKARSDQRVIVTGDTDFGALLALSHETSPSVILFRRRGGRRPEAQAEMLLRYLDEIAHDLTEGAIAVIHDDRIRVRRLPLLPADG